MKLKIVLATCALALCASVVQAGDGHHRHGSHHVGDVDIIFGVGFGEVYVPPPRYYYDSRPRYYGPPPMRRVRVVPRYEYHYDPPRRYDYDYDYEYRPRRHRHGSRCGH